MGDGPFEIRLDLKHGYQFDADFGLPGVAPLATDEPPPLGDGTGPNPARLFAAAIGNCLGASLLFCLRKARVKVEELTVRVRTTQTRNAQGRLRIGAVAVTLEPLVAVEQTDRVARCRELFEDFCIVTASVRQGVPVETQVTVRTPALTAVAPG